MVVGRSELVVGGTGWQEITVSRMIKVIVTKRIDRVIKSPFQGKDSAPTKMSIYERLLT
jgi:hypothetical protein